MFKLDSNKLGKKIAEGFNSSIYEYLDQGPEKNSHLVKRIHVKDMNKLMEYIEEFACGFNNKHAFVLNYKGLDIRETSQEGYKHIVYIKMKAGKQNMRELIREAQKKEVEKKNLDKDRIIAIFYSLASALAYLEKKDIVHSNIMHDSVLFNEDETVKLAGFAFSKYKPWRRSEIKVYQSYHPPERIKRLESKTRKEEKKVAFKSDVWCLGKLIIDLCLLRDQIFREKSLVELRKRIEVDLEEIEKIYGDKNLIEVIKSLLEEKREDRPTFEEIATKLDKSYPYLHLIEMKNREEEKPKFDLSLSTISDKEDESQFAAKSLLKKPEKSLVEKNDEQEEVKFDFEEEDQTNSVQNNLQKMIEAYQDIKKLLGQDLEISKARIEAALEHKIEEPQISKEKIDGFFQQAKDFLNSFESLNSKYQSFQVSVKRLNLSQDQNFNALKFLRSFNQESTSDFDFDFNNKNNEVSAHAEQPNFIIFQQEVNTQQIFDDSQSGNLNNEPL